MLREPFKYSGRGFALVWSTSRSLTVVLALLTVAAGAVPGAIAWVGKLIVDAVVLAIETGDDADRWRVVELVILEGGLVTGVAAIRRGLGVCQSLLRALLGHRVNMMVLDKAQTLALAQFEDSETYDKMTRARREASSRPLSLVNRTYGMLQNTVSLLTFGGLLLSFSWIAVLGLAVAGIPAFIAETRFAGEGFRLFRWRTPEKREQAYYELMIAREDYAKETQLFGLAPRFLARYAQIFRTLYAEDRSLTLRRGVWGFLLGLISTAAFYGAYAWIAIEAAFGRISLGEMTMYVLIFRQGQNAFSAILTALGGMVEDNLYLSNLYEFLELPTRIPSGVATVGLDPGDGLRIENLSFTYPGAERPALTEVSLHVRPGQKLALVGQNGSGKTTLIKLIARLYEPSGGRICLDGRDVRDWDLSALRARVGVIFQDFVRYQLPVGENIGVGDVDRFDDEAGWDQAAAKGMAKPFIDTMSEGYHTQLGRWFRAGRELSGGQWQKIALSRAFMRQSADVLVLDEPTSAMDAEAEAMIFDRVREMTDDKMAILISHRFSTVRMADRIAVMEAGRVIEEGSHDDLNVLGGHYARLFELQAAGYR